MVGIKDGLLDKTIKAPTYTVKEIVQAILTDTSLITNLAYRNTLDLREIKERLGISRVGTRSAMGDTMVFSTEENASSLSQGRKSNNDTVWKTEEEEKKKEEAANPLIWSQ